jgi:hypothetical protein
MSEFDTYKSCKDLKSGEDCPYRSIFQPCHSTCEGYKFRREKQDKINQNRRASKNVPTAHYEKAKIDLIKRQKKKIH